MSLRRLLQAFDGFKSAGLMRGRHGGGSRIAAFFLGCGALLASANAYSQSAAAPTITVSRSSSPLIAGQSYTTTWSTTNATSVKYNCTANGTGLNGSATLAANGSSSDTAQNAWVGYPSTCIWTATGPGGTKTLSETLTTFAAGNSAQFVSQKVPATIGTNQSGGVSVTLKNTGNTTWMPGSYRLGSQNPQDNQIWKTAKRIELDAPVAPGEQKTFSFFISSPATPNTYNFQWRMVKGTDEWFGDTTPNAQINVNASNTSEACAWRYPPSGVYTGSASGHQVTGNNIDGYAVSPDISREIVHAGLVLPGQSAAIVVTMLDMVPQLTGTTANGITSSSYASPYCAMRLSLAETPAITVVRNPSALIPGQSYTTTWNTTNATSVSYNCTAAGTGFNGSATLEANGSSSDVAKSTWVGYPSTCTWTATGLGGTKTISETVTTVADFSAPTLTVTRNPSPLVAGQSYTTTWNTTNATSVTYNCTANGTGFNGSATLAANGSSSDTAQNAWVGYPSTCTWTATGPGGTKTISETLTTAAAVNNAQSTSYGVPTTMDAGRSYPNFSVTMKNTGNTTWMPGSYRLGSQNPQDNQNWVASKRIELDTPVAPGQEKQFLFNVTAPTVPNTYSFQWKMVKGDNEWFGDPSPNVQVNVNAANISDSCKGMYQPSGVYTGATSGGRIWGNNTDGYTRDSNIGMAIVHAGLVSPGQSASIVVTMLDMRPQFTGTTANGITTDSFAAAYCAMRLSVKSPAPVAPTLTVQRNPTTLIAGQSYTTTWSTTNATSVTYNCTASGTGFNGSATLAANGSSSDVAQGTWIAYPSKCTWTATGPGGTKTVTETLTTKMADPPTLTITRNPSTLVAGQSYTTTWSTTNATSVTYSCTAGGTGFNGSATLDANGSSSDVAQSSWVAYPSICTWTATGPSGTKTISETLTTVSGIAPTITVTRSASPLIAGQSYTTTWNTTNATSVSYNCAANGTGFNGNATLAIDGTSVETAQAAWSGNPSTCTWTATGPGGTKTLSETLTTVAAANNAQFVSQSVPAAMETNKAVSVSVTLKNTGNTVWTPTDDYKLGAQNPQDSRNWVASKRIPLDVPVFPGEQKTFSFTAIAPATPNTYNFQWKMVKGENEWFGDATPNVPVNVSATNISEQCLNATPRSGVYTGAASGGQVVGNNTDGYTADSNMSMAIVHAGLVLPGQSASIVVTMLDTLPQFTGTTVNGVTTSSSPNPSCAMRLSVAEGPAPTITVSRNPPTLIAGKNFTTTWSTTDATLVTYNCGGGGTAYSGIAALPPNGSSSAIAQSEWISRPSVCTWTATGPGGTKTISETVMTAAEAIPPTLTVTRNPSTLIAGESYTTTWSTTDATSVRYNCTANGTGFSGTATLAANGSSSDTAQNAWIAYPSTCTWTASGAGGTKTVTETVTTTEALAPTLTVTRNPSTLIAGQSYTTTWSTTDATSVSYNCTTNGTGFSGTATLAANGSSADTAQGEWVGYPSACMWTATGPGGTKTINETVTTVAGAGVSVPGSAVEQINNAEFVSQNVPIVMIPGQTYPISITIKNTGNTTWPSSSTYKLGTQNPQDNTIWRSSNRVELSSAVNPGQLATFNFTVTAPATPGIYNFQWKMVREFVEWFGGATPNVEIVVNAATANDAKFISQIVPTQMNPGQTYPVSITFRNTGSTTWTAADAYRLGTQNPQDNTTWVASKRAELPAPVAPGERVTFNFNVTAPATTGSYDFQWEMLREFVEWFGAVSPNATVLVAPTSGTLKATLNASPTNVRVASGQNAAIVLTGAGEDSSSRLAKIELFQDSGNGYGSTPIYSAANPGNTAVTLALNKTVNLAPGFYRFKLRSTDTQNNVTESAIVPVNVTASSLLGTSNGVRVDAYSVPQLNGWVCQDGSVEALTYQLFINAPNAAMGGTQVSSGTADLATDPDNASVQATCHTPGTGHHFNIDLTAVSASITGGIPAGTPLYVQARTSNGTSIILPCGDNNCTMPGSLRIGLTTPLDGDRYQAPATVFMRAKLSNGTGPYDEVAFNINGEWIAGQADTAADTYFASKTGLPASSTPYPVMAKVRQGSSTLYSVVNMITVGGAGGITIKQEISSGGAIVNAGAPITLVATLAGETASVASVKFYANGGTLANGTLIATGANNNDTWSAVWSSAQAGTYTITATAYDANGNTLVKSSSSTLIVSSNNNSPSSAMPFPVASTPPHLSNPDAGSLPGGLSVGNGGAASYSIPLPVPPGTGGMAPALSLNYSSNGGNGFVGLGWALGGLSTIYRCAKTIVQDGVPGRISFDAADRLCLDGARLVRADGANPGTDVNAIDAAYWAAGAQYRTEQESFTRITRLANGGFKVESKDGRVHYYGIDANNAIAVAAQGRTDVQPLAWALARTEDRSGNYMTYQYKSIEGGEYVPMQIRYGGNTVTNQAADLAVRFEYDDVNRRDSTYRYIGGSESRLRSLLTHIRTYINTAADGSGGTLVRDHEVHYNLPNGSKTTARSLVEWMQACALNSQTGALECLPKTTFDWGTGGSPAFKPSPIQPFAMPMIGSLEPVRIQGNFDGGGRTSFVAAEAISCGNACSTSTIAGKATSIISGRVRIRLPNGQVVDRTLDLGAAGIQPSVFNSLPSVMVGDLDGDGRDDLVLADHANRKWAYCLNTSVNSGSVDFNCRPGGEGGIPALVDLRNERKMHLLMPFDSNGMGSDCQVANGAVQCTPMQISASSEMKGADFYSISTGINLSQEGMTDFILRFIKVDKTGGMVLVKNGLAPCYNKQSGVTCQTDAVATAGDGSTISDAFSVGDLNGDGLTDFAYSITDTTTNKTDIYTCLSTENGVFCDKDLGLNSVENLVSPSFGVGTKVGNFAGDGINRLLFAVIPTDSNNQPDLSAATSKLCRFDIWDFTCTQFAYSPAAGKDSLTAFLDDSGVPVFLVKSDSNVPGLDPNGIGPWDGISTQGTTMQPGYKAFTLVGPPEQDKIIGVTNGFGQREEVTYAYGDDNEVYARLAVIDGVEQRPAYPKVAMSPGPLVKEVRRSNGQGGWLRTTYRYEGNMVDVQGRGALGFAKVQATDSQSGISAVSILSQEYPYIGLTLRSQTTSGTGVVLNNTQNTFDRQTFTLPSGAQTVFAFVKQTQSDGKDLDGSALGSNTTVNEYKDGWGNLTQQTVTTTGSGQSFTQVTSSAYNNDSNNWLLGRLASATVTKSDQNSSLSRSTAFTYDTVTGLLKTEKVEPGNATYEVVTTYDRSGNPFGLVNKVIRSWLDPYSNTTINRTVSDTAYDAKGRFAISVKNVLGHTETHSYDPGTGAVLSLQGPNLLPTTWTVDGFGRVSKELRADGNETRKYVKQCQGDCPAGAVIASITENFHGADRIAVPSVAYSDSAGHTIRALTWGFDGRAIVSDQRFNARGNLYDVDQPHFDGDSARLASRYVYDDLNRVTDVITFDEAGTEQTSHTDYQGLTTVKTNAKKQQRIETSDILGRVVQIMDAKAGLTKMTYDPYGNLKTTVDPNGNTVSMDYDKAGRKTDLRDPDLGWIHYDIDPIGQVWRQTSPVQRAKGTYTRFEFDALGRMTGRYEPDLESHWVYDTAANGIGKLAEAYTGTASAKDYRRLHTYDSLGRPLQTTQVLFDGNYVSKTDYDAWGREIRMTHQRGSDGPKVYDVRYNTKGYRVRVERGGLVLWNASKLDAAGRVTQALLGNGLMQTRSYNIYSGRLESAQLIMGGNVPRLQEGYQYDVVGNVMQRTHYWDMDGFQESFDYDELNRLKKSQIAGLAEQSFRYDSAGNLQSKTGTGTGDYVYPTQGVNTVRPHAVQSIPGVGSFSYDNNGNLISGAGRTLTWKSFDMPDTIVKGTQSASFTYGPEHQRTRQTRGDGSVTVYAGAQEVERNSAGTEVTVKTYWPYGLGVEIDRPNAATELNWTHTDHLGSVAAITDAAGNLKEKLAYDAWGKRRTLDGSATPDSLDGQVDNKGYTGHEMLDQLDLVHMNGRVYDPAIGRVMSADPIIQEPANGQNYNRYSYVINNPLIYTDPSGFSFWTKLRDKVIKPVAIAVAAYFTGGLAYEAYMGAAVAEAGGAMAITGAQFAAASQTAAVLGGAAGGFTGGFLASGGNFQAGLRGAATGAAFGWAGGVGADASSERYAAHALVGCASGTLQGGGCGRGAMSAVAGKFATNEFGGNPFATVVSGGVVSVIGGGKFEDGALTATYGYLFNKCAHPPGCNFKEQMQAFFDQVDTGLQYAAENGGCIATGGADICLGPGSTRVVGGIGFDVAQLQAKFKHAIDFGVSGNWGKGAADIFQNALMSHIEDGATQVIQGSYRGNPVTHYFNPGTNLNVIVDSVGNFLSGWKLNPQQVQKITTTGKLGGG